MDDNGSHRDRRKNGNKWLLVMMAVGMAFALATFVGIVITLVVVLQGG